eukprot:CAMPEP_0185577638 /NCGR_PEP_ID=MMETSP0434-20130131/10580_1 /TAXON_ID=626734 ORGANISM="Favella taraikaensis, Strain Fe Narragansett Bay" /NCGR_SAMPLE_ID=MMETSP0434 /ASSEMBLY_ACC=CAM_ASM_000379 /LENGTH=53 /DNA_ID=CAMNT_0028195259 /DNA_START=163 /DNA_END=324 /DNA_ORIENTATION=-
MPATARKPAKPTAKPAAAVEVSKPLLEASSVAAPGACIARESLSYLAGFLAIL